jgi:large subunit ribosomal protein L9
MKVILLEDIDKFGKRNEVREAKAGYVRNFLLPRKLATLATPAALKELEKRQAVIEEQKKVLQAEAEEKAKELKKQTLSFKLKVGESGEVFGSVAKKDIEHALGDKGFGGSKVVLEQPFKELGEHQVEVDLGGGVKAKVKIHLEQAS